MRRSLAAIAAAALTLVLACGSDDEAAGEDGGASATAMSTQAARATQSATTAAAPASSQGTAVQLSGAVTGAMTVQGRSCAPAGTASIIVSISGQLGTAQYTLELNAPRSGTYQLPAAQGAAGATAQLLGPSSRRWAAGTAAAAGSGSLTAGERSGEFNVELVPSAAGTEGNVRAQGRWACP